MIVKKPSIFIYTHLADEAILREVCAGVEEEGVFYEITEFPDECMECQSGISDDDLEKRQGAYHRKELYKDGTKGADRA